MENKNCTIKEDGSPAHFVSHVMQEWTDSNAYYEAIIDRERIERKRSEKRLKRIISKLGQECGRLHKIIYGS